LIEALPLSAKIADGLAIDVLGIAWHTSPL
jgi:hypothetical protein